MARFLNQALILDSCVVQWGSKSKHHKDICLKEIGLCLEILITTLHLIKFLFRRTYVSILEINKHALLIIITKSRDVRFLVRFFLQMFHRVNLISRDMKNEPNNTHILKVQKVKRLMGPRSTSWCFQTGYEIEANVNWWFNWKKGLRLPNTTFLNNDGYLSLMGLYRGLSNTKCASFLIALQEQTWHNLLSLEIEIVQYRPISMASLWFDVWYTATTLHCGGVNDCLKYNLHLHLRKSLRWR